VTLSTGDRLGEVLRRELIQALQEAVSQVAGELGGLAPDESFADPPFAGRVLAPVGSANPVLTALRVLESAPAAGVEGSLRGWRDEPTDGAPVGVAYVARSGGAVAAVSLLSTGGAPLTLRAAGFGGAESVQLAIGGGLTLSITGSTSEGELAVAFSPDGPPAVSALGASDRLDISLTGGDPAKTLGTEGGPAVRLGQVDMSAWIAGPPATPLDRGGRLSLKGGEVALAPGFVESLIGSDLSFPLDLDVRLGPGTGVSVAGSPSLRTRLPGPDSGRWLDLAIDLTDAPGASSLDVSFLTSLDFSLPGAPVSTHIAGLGLRLPIGLRPGAPILPDISAVAAVEPAGAGVSVDLPVVSGSGMLARDGDDLVGALAVEIPPMSASAFGVLTPPRAGGPLSLLVIMGATFPPPGVQIGFGFAISGVGGVVGINRRIDRDALMRAVTDGSAAHILFPSDPVGAGQGAIRALPALFPVARGSVVAGPMFQLSWGGRVITMSVAVLVEAATQARLTVMGKLVVALPDPEAPLVFLQATFAGFIDPAEPSVMFVASLNGSHIVGATVAGDILLLTRGGSDPTVVLSAGGFHPSFRPPRGVPALNRMSMDMCPAPWIDLRCETYFAVTSNTLQLGARLELVAEVAECGLRGWLAFDALVQYKPFHFLADMSGGIALRVFGETLAGISLALHLEGPSPYLARGRGSIELFIFEVSFDFEVGWGSPAPELVASFDVAGELRKALEAPSAWGARGAAPPGIALTEPAQARLSKGSVVDPYGTISVRQERVPLGIEIARFNGVSLPQPLRFDITGADFREGEPARRAELRADFAPGQFLAPRSDDEALSAPAFRSLAAGTELAPEPATGAEARPAGLTWEERVISPGVEPRQEPAGPLVDLGMVEVLLDAMSMQDSGWWVVPDEGVGVEPVPPVAGAVAWSMEPVPDITAATDVELLQTLAEDTDLVPVEVWELR
jgi:hypothetical protein